MNILLLNWRDPANPLSGGAEYVTAQHAKYWVRCGDCVTWFSSTFRGAKSQEITDGVTFVRRGNFISVFLFAAIYYFFHKSEVDIIVDQVHGVPFFALLYAKKPVILFVHEIAGRIWDFMYPAPICWVGKLLELFYLRVYQNHVIWTDAESTVNELVSLGIARNRCKAIPCPIASSPIAQWPKKNTELMCIFVGRIVRMKRIEDLLKAFADIQKVFPKATFHIVGEGNASYVSMLNKVARELQISDHVYWHGKVSEKKKLAIMGESHVLLHASVKEGWGLVVLEAGSQWTPSVVYGVGGLVDTVKDGDTGIIVNSCSPHDLARSVVDLYTNKHVYHHMQKRAHEWSGSFRWTDAVKQSRDLLYHVYEAE